MAIKCVISRLCKDEFHETYQYTGASLRRHLGLIKKSFSVTIVHTPAVLHILLCILCAYKYLEQIKIGAINCNGPQPVYQFIVIQICQACDSSMLSLFSKELNGFYLSPIFFSPSKRGPSVRSAVFYTMNPSLVIKTFVYLRLLDTFR